MTVPEFLRATLACVFVLWLAGCATQPQSSKREPASTSAPTAATAKVAVPGPLFDGKTLAGWAITDFAGHGAVTTSNGQIQLGMGYMTGIHWTNPMPRMGYEISLEAMRVDGSDFFCGLTFPVATNHCSFIVGGWGGGVVGLSSIDGEDASQNETTTYMNFTNNKWYRIRVRVELEKIQAWIDDDRVVNVETKDRRLGIRLEMESSTPLGIATWNTAAALRNIELKKL